MEGVSTCNHLNHVVDEGFGADGAILVGLCVSRDYAGHEELGLGTESWRIAGWVLGVECLELISFLTLVRSWSSHGCA